MRASLRKHRGYGAAAVLTVALLSGAAGCGGGDRTETGAGTTSSISTPATNPPSTTPATNPPVGPAPSQSAEEAARDGVVAAFATLPLDVRMDVVASVEAPEGVWVASRPTRAADRYAAGCRIGPEEGQTPTDWICTSEYGEILLLDAGRTRILRAYPLAGVPPAVLRLTDEAVYCARGGDGGLLPDSMACRIDRRTLAATIRVFPGEPDSVVVQPCFTPPASWAIDSGYLPIDDLTPSAGGVRVSSERGVVTLDPLSLVRR